MGEARMRGGWILGLAGLAVSPAIAADLPLQPVPPLPAYLWTGFYAGVNLGGDWRATGADASGVIGGAQVGYNWQFGSLVLGGETDIQGTSLNGSTVLFSAIGNSITSNTSLDYLGTLRGRVGFALDRWLVYGTGGLAYTTINHGGVGLVGVSGTYSGANTVAGFAAGGGVEWAFADRWSAKAEYLYSQFAGFTNVYTTTSHPITVRYGDLNLNILRLGVNYRFSP
jgi:outer membrane immunogenic protein